jgi:hypothetical protein
MFAFRGLHKPLLFHPLAYLIREICLDLSILDKDFLVSLMAALLRV